VVAVLPVVVAAVLLAAAAGAGLRHG
jgi:hypothetical protein